MKPLMSNHDHKSDQQFLRICVLKKRSKAAGINLVIEHKYNNMVSSNSMNLEISSTIITNRLSIGYTILRFRTSSFLCNEYGNEETMVRNWLETKCLPPRYTGTDRRKDSLRSTELVKHR